jgi:uncharacterized membrane protein
MAPLPHQMLERIGARPELDAVARPLHDAVERAAPEGSTAHRALSGAWLGHPLHPLLTDVAIGFLTNASVLDLVGGRSSRKAADRLLLLGLASAAPTALAGAVDWSDVDGEEKRLGVVHAASNTVGLCLYGLSAVARRRGRRGRGVALALAGMSVMTVGGYIGGHMVFASSQEEESTTPDGDPIDLTAASASEAVTLK